MSQHLKFQARYYSFIRAIVSPKEKQIVKLGKVLVNFIGYSSLDFLFIVKLIQALITILVY